MSYDLTLFQAPGGVDPRARYEQAMEQHWARGASSLPLSEDALARRRSTADALKRWRPSLDEFEPHTPQPSIELTDKEFQIQFSVYEYIVEITVPYFRGYRDQAMVCIAESLDVLRLTGGFHAYDPQLDRIVTSEDGAALLERYNGVDLSVILQAFPKESESEASAKKPWWKFW